MSETIQGNTIRAEEISYDFNLHRWQVVYSSATGTYLSWSTREAGETATLQEVFNLLIQEIKKK